MSSFASAGEWTESLDDGLWSYYTLNESTGDFLDLTLNTTGAQYAFTNASSRGIQAITIKSDLLISLIQEIFLIYLIYQNLIFIPQT